MTNRHSWLIIAMQHLDLLEFIEHRLKCQLSTEALYVRLKRRHIWPERNEKCIASHRKHLKYSKFDKSIYRRSWWLSNTDCAIPFKRYWLRKSIQIKRTRFIFEIVNSRLLETYLFDTAWRCKFQSIQAELGQQQQLVNKRKLHISVCLQPAHG